MMNILASQARREVGYDGYARIPPTHRLHGSTCFVGPRFRRLELGTLLKDHDDHKG